MVTHSRCETIDCILRARTISAAGMQIEFDNPSIDVDQIDCSSKRECDRHLNFCCKSSFNRSTNKANYDDVDDDDDDPDHDDDVYCC